MSVVELFKKECSFMRAEANGNDCFVYPNIPEAVRATIRSNFGIGNEDNILLIRDTSFWNNRDQGLVITDIGFYCIVDNEDPQPFSFDWEDITDVRYQELCLYFNEQEEIPIHMDYFMKSNDDNDMARIGRKLATAFTKIAQSVEPAEDPSYEAWNYSAELIDQKKYQECIDHCFTCLANNFEPLSIWHLRLSEIYLLCPEVRNLDKCIEHAQKVIEKDELADSLILLQRHYLYLAYQFSGMNSQARAECLNVMLTATDETLPGSETLIKDEAIEDFQINEEKYKEEFLTFPYNERKVLMPVKNYVNLNQEHIAVIDIKNLPAICFPMGHPIANQLYVGHPLIPSKYIPFENYQLELVEDRVREFCMLVQSLGATDISIECLNSASADQSNNSKQNMSGSVDTWIYDGKASLQTDVSRHMIDELSRSISLHQTFEPHNKPTLPEGMVWYANEPSWQRLVSQRLSGHLTSHEERIETKKSQMVEGRELLDIKAEVRILYADMNMAMDKTEESKFTQQENAVLSIKVKFAPINQLTGEASTAQITASPTTGLTSEEEEYMTELKEILADGEISPRERRLLERIRIQCGISEERAVTLEQSLASLQLTAEEQEYLDEYKEIAADGEITEKERRLLDKILRLNGISQERAREIEASVRR